MKWLMVSVAAINVTAFSPPAFSQSIHASSLTAQKPAVVTGASDTARYITDVTGKRVRLGGPRFYPDTANAIQLSGREKVNAEDASLNGETAR